MRGVLLIVALSWAQIRLSQNPVSGDCRLSMDSLVPVTPAFFPYLYRYEWDPVKKLETLWLSPHLRIRIEQRACIRHHISYEVRVPPSYPLQGGFTRGLMALMDTILVLLHRHNPRFLRIKNEVFPKLLQQAAIRSVGEVIMLPYHEWSFLLRMDHDKEGPYVVLETIQYLSSQAIQRPGVPEYMDDAVGP
ncbi:MAG: hypothetical protein NZZ60_05605 [Bacteroidia bacterium]|nr:hypothetical protein [Bacteroidia bacterium]MCX7652296.1 hypothetical protein [Bacteroidia bacterium]MDW8416558.1 hypothetical protein [Bacteroidia bacterium]